MPATGISSSRRRVWLRCCSPERRGSAAKSERAFRHLPRRGRLLDVGCGSGDFVAHAESVGWRASGIDIDDKALRAGRQAGYDLRTQTLAEHDDGSYDAITLSHAIEHVSDPVALLREAAQRLAPDGLLWIATPNLASLGHRRYRDAWFGLDPPRYLVLFEHRSLQLALTRAGFGRMRDVLHMPIAGAYFAASQAVRDGGRPVGATPSRAIAVRGAIADRAARRRPELGEELVGLVGQ